MEVIAHGWGRALAEFNREETEAHPFPGYAQ